MRPSPETSVFGVYDNNESSASEFVEGDLLQARSHGLGSRALSSQAGAPRKDFAKNFSAVSPTSAVGVTEKVFSVLPGILQKSVNVFSIT